MYDNPRTTLNPLPIFILIVIIVAAIVVIISAGAGKEQPITITQIDFANVEKGKIIGSYGTTFNSSALKYIAPRIIYDSTGNASGEITLDIKIIQPDGNIMSSSASPRGYTYNDTLEVQAGKSGETITLIGWENEKGGTYSEGTYICEIWNNGKKLYVGNFMVTTTPQLMAPSNIRSSSTGINYVTLNWNSAGSGVSYKVYYNIQNDVANAKSITATENTATVSGLAENTTYYFWVASVQNGNEARSTKALMITTSSKTTVPPSNPLPGTTWEYINQNDNGNRYRLTFSGSNAVTFAIYNRDGSSTLDSYKGTYSLRGNNLTVVIEYPEGKTTASYTYSQTGIVDKQKQSIIYKPR
jgi:hypothetical protein